MIYKQKAELVQQQKFDQQAALELAIAYQLAITTLVENEACNVAQRT
jgi:hypothetical protein